MMISKWQVHRYSLVDSSIIRKFLHPALITYAHVPIISIERYEHA